jgi:L-alanine-DL-glutamate epimerase-like enolase superfamily enzyme
MKLEVHPYHLEFIRPFALAHGTRTGTSLAFVKLEFEDIISYGEASLPPYRKETFESVKKWIEQQREYTEEIICKDFFSNPDRIPFSSENPSASAALQSALINFYAQKTKKSIPELLNVKSSHPLLTLTVTKNDFNFLDEKLKLAKNFTHFKLKLTGSDDDFDFAKAIRAKTDIPFCIDFNQGYSKKEDVIKLIEKLEKINAALMEQPLKDVDHDGHFWLKSRITAPLVADESICTFNDLQQFHEAYSGVNVKLMKCGGLFQAKKMIEFAAEKKMYKLIGCMSESSLGVSMAAYLAPLCNMADLDSPYLNNNDPFRGFQINQGYIQTENITVNSGLFMK